MVPTVRGGQAAVFVHEEQWRICVFTEDAYMLKPATCRSHDHLPWDPFQIAVSSEIYYVQHRGSSNLKWGAKLIMLRDLNLDTADPARSGTYSVRVTDPRQSSDEIVGTDEIHHGRDRFQIHNIIVSRSTQIIASSGIAVHWTWPRTPPIWAS
jgi:membrane protease subunit (stomatin/prohibitin family)